MKFVYIEIVCTPFAKPLQLLLPGGCSRICGLANEKLAGSEVLEAGIALGVRAIADHGVILLSRFLFFRVEVKGHEYGNGVVPF